MLTISLVYVKSRGEYCEISAAQRQGVEITLSTPSFTPSYHRAASRQNNVDRSQSHISFSLGILLLALHKLIVHPLRDQ
jgi:hypothetical protein